MSDDFERRLAVALKTAADDLAPDAVTDRATPWTAVEPSDGPHRNRPRLLLAAAVVVLLVAAVGGAWWAVTGTHDDHARPAGAACTADDVSASQVGVRPSGSASFPGAEIEVRARTTCTLATAPSLVLDAAPVYWRSSDPDAVDPSAWVPVPLVAGGHATFTLRSALAVTQANCPAMVERPVTLHFGLDDGADLLSFSQTAITGCATFSFTTSYPAPPPASDASAPCTAPDLTASAHDLGDGIDGVGIDVVAKVGCTLQQSPTVTVDDIATSPDVPGNPVPPWQRTRIAAGQSVTLAVDPHYLGDCTTYGPRRVVASLGGTVLANFTWTTVISCPGAGFGLELRPGTVSVAHPCTGADLELTPILRDSVATARLTSRNGATCTLVDPPTVLTGDDLAPFGLDADLHASGGWTPRPVGPGRDVDLEIAADPRYQACNGQSRGFRHGVDVTVRVGPAAVGTFAWTYVGCGATLVTTVR